MEILVTKKEIPAMYFQIKDPVSISSAYTFLSEAKNNIPFSLKAGVEYMMLLSFKKNKRIKKIGVS